MSSTTDHAIAPGPRSPRARRSTLALLALTALLACSGAPPGDAPRTRAGAVEAPPRPEARTADLPLDAELARRLAALADRIDAEPTSTAALLRDAGLPLDGYIERLHAIALDPRLAAIYSDARRPPDVDAMAHVLDDADP